MHLLVIIFVVIIIVIIVIVIVVIIIVVAWVCGPFGEVGPLLFHGHVVDLLLGSLDFLLFVIARPSFDLGGWSRRGLFLLFFHHWLLSLLLLFFLVFLVFGLLHDGGDGLLDRRLWSLGGQLGGFARGQSLLLLHLDALHDSMRVPVETDGLLDVIGQSLPDEPGEADEARECPQALRRDRESARGGAGEPARGGGVNTAVGCGKHDDGTVSVGGEGARELTGVEGRWPREAEWLDGSHVLGRCL
mmetsp:Transcript_14685/g.40599  ORF Transcript_14685/g.40599 Transcript_14685/m.40599 type:complete len:245 (+) Transcript_14685:1210-1944(+)